VVMKWRDFRALTDVLGPVAGLGDQSWRPTIGAWDLEHFC
jgi:hypothetical protein